MQLVGKNFPILLEKIQKILLGHVTIKVYYNKFALFVPEIGPLIARWLVKL